MMTEKYSFLIDTPQGSYELKADTESELSSWNSPEIAEMIRNLLRPDSVSNCKTPGDNKYRLTFKTPHGCYHVEADSAAKLVMFSSQATTGTIKSLIGSESKLALGLAVRESLRVCNQSGEADFDLDVAAREALATYYANKQEPKRRYHGTRLAQVGLELDLIKCYLQDMTAKQIKAWFKQERKFDVSISVIGRFIRILWRNGVRPIKKTTCEINNE